MILDSVLLSKQPLILSRVSRLQTPPYSDGLQCYNLSHDFECRLPTLEGSESHGFGPCIPAQWLRRSHMSRNSQRVADLKNKEMLS
jgi:hypothetical protein